MSDNIGITVKSQYGRPVFIDDWFETFAGTQVDPWGTGLQYGMIAGRVLVAERVGDHLQARYAPQFRTDPSGALVNPGDLDHSFQLVGISTVDVPVLVPQKANINPVTAGRQFLTAAGVITAEQLLMVEATAGGAAPGGDPPLGRVVGLAVGAAPPANAFIVGRAIQAATGAGAVFLAEVDINYNWIGG